LKLALADVNEHHTRGTSSGGNDGIEVKYRSFGNTIRNNVIHDTINGTAYPCIFVYGGGAGVNIVEARRCGTVVRRSRSSPTRSSATT
jgi:hypothetical protein